MTARPVLKIREGVLRAIFIFLLFVSHLAASNCCALAAYTRSNAFCPDHCQSITGDAKNEDGKEKQTGDRCVSCPSQELKKAALPDDVSPAPVLPPVLDFNVCLYLTLIWQETEPVPLPKVEERVESSERRWHFITRASGWSRAPSCPVA